MFLLIKFLENAFWKFRSSHSQLFFKIDFLKNFAILTGRHLLWSLFLIKLQAWTSITLFKKRLYNSCFCVNIVKFLIKLFVWNTSSGCFFLRMVEEFLRNSNLKFRGICTEEFVRSFNLRKICLDFL